MKKFFLSAVLSMLTALSGMAQVGDKLFVNDFSINPGETIAVSINLSNPETDYAAFQFDLILPEGVSIALTKRGKLDVKLDGYRFEELPHSLSTEKITEGVYRFICFSMSGESFWENSGAIVNMNIEASDTFNAVNMTGSVENIVLTTSEAKETKPEKTTFTITNPTAAGITSISVEQPADIYDVNGNLIRKEATTINGLTKGIYIVKGQKILVK